MKVNDFAWQVAMRTIELLEELQHYKVSADSRKEIGGRIAREVDDLLRKSS